MKKANFLMIAVSLILVIGTWLIVQVVFEQAQDAKQISGSDSYYGLKEDTKAVIKIASSTKEHCYNDLICLGSPALGDRIESPLIIKGKARGIWYFEGDFPLVLTNWDGLIIAEGYASAKEDWMTEDYVEFEAVLEFEADTSVSNRGALILQRDNPSAMPENDDAMEVNILF